MYLRASLNITFVKILFVMCICFSAYSTEAKANSNLVNIDIYDYTYQAVLIENTALKNKLSDILSSTDNDHQLLLHMNRKEAQGNVGSVYALYHIHDTISL